MITIYEKIFKQFIDIEKASVIFWWCLKSITGRIAVMIHFYLAKKLFALWKPVAVTSGKACYWALDLPRRILFYLAT